MMDIQDMVDLIYARDAYKAMNKSLLGEEMVLGFHKGYLGAIGRISRVIERNVPAKWKKEDGSVMKILDAILLTPEKRAKLLLGENKNRIGEERVIEKYKFSPKLKEGTLMGRIKGQASVVIDGKEVTAQCSARGKINCTEGLPCLVSENHNDGSVQYIVEAVSFDNHQDKRNWICIRPLLLGKAVEHFLENHQMEKMVKNYDHVNKMSTATAGKGRPDFQVGNIWIEVRNLGRKSSGYAQESLALSIRQIEKYCEQLYALKGLDERMILLFLNQYEEKGEKEILFNKKTNEILGRVIQNGVEIWMANLQFDADGISLLACQNIVDKILNN